MEIKELNKNITEGRFSNIYYFYGNEEYLKKLYIEKIINKLITKELKAFNLFIFKENVTIDQVEEAVEQFPVMSDHKVVFFDKADIYGKDAQFREKFLEIIEDMPSYCTLIIKEDKTDERTKLGKKIQKSAELVLCDYPQNSDMKAFIAREFKKFGKKISAQNAQMIIDQNEKNLFSVLNLIQSVSMYLQDQEEVSKNAISLFVFKPIEAVVFDLSDEAVNGNLYNAYKILNNLKTTSSKNPPQVLFSLLSIHISKLFIVDLASKAKYDNVHTAGLLGDRTPTFVVSKYSRQLQKLDSKKLSTLLIFCADNDYILKTSPPSDPYLPIYKLMAMIHNCKKN